MVLKVWWCLVVICLLVSIGMAIERDGEPDRVSAGVEVVYLALAAPLLYAAFRYIFGV